MVDFKNWLLTFLSPDSVEIVLILLIVMAFITLFRLFTVYKK